MTARNIELKDKPDSIDEDIMKFRIIEEVRLNKFEGEMDYIWDGSDPVPLNLVESMYSRDGVLTKREFYKEGKLVAVVKPKKKEVT